MRLSITRTKTASTYYVIRSIRKDGKRSSEVVEKLGTDKRIIEQYGCSDAEKWARNYVEELNRQEKDKNHKVLVPLFTDIVIPQSEQNSYNVGCLFLQKLYYQLNLPKICEKISKKHSFSYNLNSILSRLVYGRLLYPSSKLSCFEFSKRLYEQPDFDLHQIYRALSVIAQDFDFIQAELYKNSTKIVKRKTGILYYDCTNYFFETEIEAGIKKYGASKEHRPNPLVQMGLFMDRSGLPLAFCINEGNKNEQLTLKPLEKKIISDFGLSKFVVCTDVELSSAANKKFNNLGERYFITTQSLKKMSKELKNWALSPNMWQLEGGSRFYNIDEIENSPENRKKIFYKQRYIEGYDEEHDTPFNQTLIVTFSLKYKNYQAKIRAQQIERAEKTLKNPSKIEKKGQNDFKRLIKRTVIQSDDKKTKKKKQFSYSLNQDVIDEESRYDGFYAVSTNLDDDPADIVRINHNRWEIEKSFRIMKSEFKARPVFLKRDDRIKAHFMTCFITLLIYRLLENQLNNVYTCQEIISTLRNMNLTKVGNEGFIPAYTRTSLTDSLHTISGFRTDYQLSTKKNMQSIISKSKK